MKTLSLLLCVLLSAAGLGHALAQDSPQIVCTECGQTNKAEHNYCTACGTALVETSERPESTTTTVYREPARLFSVPTASVLPELHVGVTLGNSFGQEERRSFLGNISLGLGDIAELELTTGGMVGTIVAGTTRMSTWALKVQVYSGNDRFPAIALSLRSSNDWENTRLSAEALQTSADDYFREGLRGLDYDTRMTTALITASKAIHKRSTLHGSVGFSDIRYRNLSVRYAADDFRYDPSVQRGSQLHGTAGIAVAVNPRTKVIAEVQTIPFFNYNVSRREIKLEHMYVGAVGIRYALGRAFTLDSGVRYQSNFVGLADTQVRLALNGVFVIPL